MLSEAISYYKSVGYNLVTVPWIVPKEFIKATYDGPNTGIPVEINIGIEKQFIGSAKQAFLAVWDKLEIGNRYMALTPCMRYEAGGFAMDRCRLPGFLKLELFVKGMHSAESMRKSALRFFKTWLPTVYDIEVDKGWDIMTRSGIELGSYYNTRFMGEKYSCGTGVAWERLLHSLNIKVPNLWISKDNESPAPDVSPTN